ncbi:hypothetical protein [Curtobacterium sp. MCSS17_016]|uniref:hypothetical protein n=1 Tax=Curtobacterium sp. MCSS17_016 TaxID=2175644 RepID=UPI000DA7DB37|nr:hypothetical protein [Curtobacterium sp. MCSS17_016]WIE81537.1 hypothetical protein DEJ19_020070 [Curtobacterium sp. MCSS17_016]
MSDAQPTFAAEDEDFRRFAQQVRNRVVRRRLNPPISAERAEALLADERALRQEFDARRRERSSSRSPVDGSVTTLPARETLATMPLTSALGVMFAWTASLVVLLGLGYTALQQGLAQDLVYEGDCTKTSLGFRCHTHVMAWQPDAGDIVCLALAGLCFLGAAVLVIVTLYQATRNRHGSVS